MTDYGALRKSAHEARDALSMHEYKSRLEAALAAVAELAGHLSIPLLEHAAIPNLRELDKLEALRDLFSGASRLDDDLLSDRRDLLDDTADTADTAVETAEKKIDELASVPLSPHQAAVLAHLHEQEKLETAALDDDVEDPDAGVRMMFERPELPDVYRELEALGLLQAELLSDEDPPGLWLVGLTMAGIRAAIRHEPKEQEISPAGRVN